MFPLYARAGTVLDIIESLPQRINEIMSKWERLAKIFADAGKEETDLYKEITEQKQAVEKKEKDFAEDDCEDDGAEQLFTAAQKLIAPEESQQLGPLVQFLVDQENKKYATKALEQLQNTEVGTKAFKDPRIFQEKNGSDEFFHNIIRAMIKEKPRNFPSFSDALFKVFSEKLANKKEEEKKVWGVLAQLLGIRDVRDRWLTDSQGGRGIEKTIVKWIVKKNEDNDGKITKDLYRYGGFFPKEIEKQSLESFFKNLVDTDIGKKWKEEWIKTSLGEWLRGPGKGMVSSQIGNETTRNTFRQNLGGWLFGNYVGKDFLTKEKIINKYGNIFSSKEEDKLNKLKEKAKAKIDGGKVAPGKLVKMFGSPSLGRSFMKTLLGYLFTQDGEVLGKWLEGNWLTEPGVNNTSSRLGHLFSLERFQKLFLEGINKQNLEKIMNPIMERVPKSEYCGQRLSVLLKKSKEMREWFKAWLGTEKGKAWAEKVKKK